MGMTIREVFEEWWEKEAGQEGTTSLFSAFTDGWSTGFRKSNEDSLLREKLIFDAIRPLVLDLDEIIVKALTK